MRIIFYIYLLFIYISLGNCLDEIVKGCNLEKLVFTKCVMNI